MAIELGNETKEISKEDRAWRMEIFCENNSPYAVTVHREILSTCNGEVISSERGITSKRTIEDLQDDPESLQLAEQIKKKADEWRQEDINSQTPEE